MKNPQLSSRFSPKFVIFATEYLHFSKINRTFVLEDAIVR